MSVLSLSLSRWCRLAAAALLVCSAGLAQAQSDDGAGDPPDRAARLSYASGDIGLLPAGTKDWASADLNRPLTRGDKLSSGDGARAELELDGAALRVDGDTDVGFLELNDQLAQMELTQGTLDLSVRQLGQGQSYEIDTPTVALVVDQPGSYRVDIGRDGQSTRITDFDGHATVYGENNAQRDLVAGRSYRFVDSTLDTVQLSDIDGGDDFDAWNEARDRRYADSESRRYVSDDVVGYQDLDRYGDWRSDPDYGEVWYPAHVDAGWAPYRDGHWAYIAPWGWSWVDDSPWGFAPYHYGRWAYVGDAWGWVPGPIAVRPVYAPALVAFVGGAHWGVSIGLGEAPIGWYPLGPGEVYNPWYHTSRNYYTQVNITNIHVHNDNRTVIINRIDNSYNDYRRGVPPVRAERADRAAPRGFTAVPARSFVGADRVQGHLLHADARALAAAPLVAAAALPKPTAQSFAPPRPAHAAALPAQGFHREVVARHAPVHEAATPVAQRFDRDAAPAPHLPANVRVLGHAAPQTGPRAAIAAQHPTAGPVHSVESGRPFDRNGDARLPQPARIEAATPPSEPPQRPGELRSARFARPYQPAQDAPPPRARSEQAPRPGVSFIPSAEADRQRAEHAAPHLPQPPHFERADQAPSPRQDAPDAAPAHMRAVPDMQRAPFERAPAEPAMRDNPDRMRDAPSPQRFEAPTQLRAAEFPAQMRERSAPPEHFDRAPAGYQPPRGEGPPRPMPQSAPMQHAPEPAHEQHAAPEHRPPPHRDDQQHR